MPVPRRQPTIATVMATAGVLLVGVGLAIMASSQRQPDLPSFPTVEAAEYFVVVARRAERLTADDPTPHRASLVSLYRRDGQVLRRLEESLSIRANSTMHDPPLSQEVKVRAGAYEWGYFSVPYGIFTLAEAPWRDGSTAYLISDWGTYGGTIALAEPQVIRSRSWPTENDPTDRVLRSSRSKTASYIHPSITASWSPVDSKGCMNLYKPQDHEAGTSDYKRFRSWFTERDTVAGPMGDLVALVLLPSDAIPGTTETEMPLTLPLALLERARDHQGQLHELMGVPRA